jgi:hypothetical protein
MYDWQVREHQVGQTVAGVFRKFADRLDRIYDFFAGYSYLPLIAVALVSGWRDHRSNRRIEAASNHRVRTQVMTSAVVDVVTTTAPSVSRRARSASLESVPELDPTSAAASSDNPVFWRVGVLALLILSLILWNSQYPYSYDHYFAGLTAAFMGLVLIGARQTAGWQPGGRPVGLALAASLLLVSIQGVPFRLLNILSTPATEARYQPQPRREIENELQRHGGRHVVFIRVEPPFRDFPTLAYWYHNGADPDSAAILWAQEINAGQDRAFLKMVQDRTPWVAWVRPAGARLEPYRASGQVAD